MILLSKKCYYICGATIAAISIIIISIAIIESPTSGLHGKIASTQFDMELTVIQSLECNSKWIQVGVAFEIRYSRIEGVSRSKQFFMTAYHVVAANTYYRLQFVNGDIITINNIIADPYADIAILELDGYNSTSTDNDKLFVADMSEVGNENIPKKLITTTGINQVVAVASTIYRIPHPNYHLFQVAVARADGGASGSPLVGREGNLVGILHGGLGENIVYVPQREILETLETILQKEIVLTPVPERLTNILLPINVRGMDRHGNPLATLLAVFYGQVGERDRQQLCVTNSWEQDALLLAAAFSESVIVKRLVNNCGKTDIRDILGNSAIMLAIASRNTDAVEYLLRAGVDVTQVDSSGYSLLMLSIIVNEPIIAWKLIEYGAKIEQLTPNDVSTLMLAAGSPKKGIEDLIKYLAGRGMDIYMHDSDGDTALHYAAKSGTVASVRFLLKLGADAEATNEKDETPKDFAESRSDEDGRIIARLLAES